MGRPCFKLEIGYPEPLAGVDEAGCAPLAGPVVAAAVILDRKHFPRGIDDSKNLPIDKREAIHARLVKCAVIGVGVASVEEIDTLNIYWARMLAMTRAVEALGIEPAWVLVDGNACPRWQRPSRAIVAGDARCRSIAAASIVAKVTRDRMMAERARLSGLRMGDESRLRHARASSRAGGAGSDSAAPPKLRPGPRDHRPFCPARAAIEGKPAGESFESHHHPLSLAYRQKR